MVSTRNACRGASRRVPVVLTVLAAIAVPAMAACSGAGSPDADAAALPTKPSLVVATTAAPTTTVAPTAPPSTPAPTTTAAPTTTTTTPLPPVTTLPPGPRNVEPIAAAGPYAAVGSRSGADTAAVQQRLLDLNFWLEGADGSFGLTTKQAVMAFQKYMGLGTTGSVDQATADALGAVTEQARARADAGTMVEVDKARQLLFFVVDGKTQWIFNTSTGNDQPYEEEDQNTPGEIVKDIAITPGGLHAVNRERPVGWWEGDLGRIYRPKYFVGGVAVHGSNSVPNYPASHGCVRVTIQAMDYIWNAGLLPMGTPVWVHGSWNA